MNEMSVAYGKLAEMLAARGVIRRPDGSWAEDSYDYGVWWRDEIGSTFRLTWIGARMRHQEDLAGELYLYRLGPLHVGPQFPAAGDVELLCRIPPAVDNERHPDEHVGVILEGWANVCGLPDSRAWIYDRVWEALAAGWAQDVREKVTHDV